mmetsp:Transcript_100274/g.259251  ORF Transcript_100274/g.259251 Transcript_100274/m.259251 type:complete len:427 (-) Transcript_100274:40-1320(-)
MPSGDVPVEELSLLGLLSRLDDIKHIKTIVRPTEEEQAILDAEPAVKKRIAEELETVTKSGMTSKEKSSSTSFLQAQRAAIEPGSKGADARKAKFEELLSAVSSAASKEEPDHVKKAKAAVARAEKDFEPVNKEYEKWEKGKKMLSPDELNKLKRSHDDCKKRMQVAKDLLDEQLKRRAEAAAATPAALAKAPTAAAAASRSSAASRPSGPVGNPGVRRTNPGGYPAQAVAPSALRQAQAVAQVRSDAAEAWAPPPAVVPQRRPQTKPREDRPAPVLSYSCTCAAVAEVLGIKVSAAEDLASSSSEFAEHLSYEQWERVQERSLAIEKERKEKQREAEKRKQANALAKRDAKEQKEMPIPAAMAPTTRGVVAKAPPAGVPRAPKPKAAPSAKGGLSKLATGNNFAAFGDGDSSDEDAGGGWTTVGR